MYRFILTILVLVFSVHIYAQKRIYTTAKITSEPPRIDGVFNENIWGIVEWSDGFIQREPHEKEPATEDTHFKIVYDDNNLYVAIRCLDSAPDSIVRRMSRRDGFDGDWAEINIDSYHDLRTAYSFTINAAGVKGDEAVTNDGNWDSSWDPIWYAETSVDSFGWNAEIRIPFTQLRFGKQEEYVWGLQLNRRLFRKEEASSWQFISPNAPGWVHNFGELRGIANIEPKKQKEITPYIVGGLKSYQRNNNNPFADGKDLIGNIGVDGKVGLTNDLTLDFTINPDFGQVESDPSEVNLTTFETKFQERRPFFIEGKDILSFTATDGGTPLSNDNLFYSRRIGKKPSHNLELDEDNNEYANYPENTTILGAFKLTGKTRKGWSIGLFESTTQREMAEIDSAGIRYKEPVEPFTNYLAGRLQKNFNNSNTRLGIMLTATNRKLHDRVLADELPGEAYTGGIDLSHQWKDKTYYITFKTVFSTVKGTKKTITDIQTSSPHYFQRPGAPHIKVDSLRTHLDGNGGILQFGKAGNSKWMYCTWVTWRSPGLNLNDLGYMNRNDEIQEIMWVGYRQRKQFSIFRNLNFDANQWYGLTFGNERRYAGGNLQFQCVFVNYWSIGGGISRDGKSISTETLRGGPSLVYDGSTDIWANANTDQRKKFQFYFYYNSGFRDYGTAQYQSYTLGTNFQASNTLKISAEPGFTKRNDEIDYVNTLDDLPVARYIRGNIDQTTLSMTFRLNYCITPDFTMQFYAMSFISAGKYSRFKYVSDAEAKEFNNRYVDYNDLQISYNAEDEKYEIDEKMDGKTDYSFDQPNFNKFDFNANLVIRWEYLPGSTLFLVWSQNRNDSDSSGNFAYKEDVKTLFDKYPRDVFLVKLSYRFGN
jgi:hypothetical protein